MQGPLTMPLQLLVSFHTTGKSTPQAISLWHCMQSPKDGSEVAGRSHIAIIQAWSTMSYVTHALDDETPQASRQ